MCVKFIYVGTRGAFDSDSGYAFSWYDHNFTTIPVLSTEGMPSFVHRFYGLFKVVVLVRSDAVIVFTPKCYEIKISLNYLFGVC